MHGNSGQYKDAYLQLTDVIKDTPHLFTNTSTYTLPTSSLASVQSYSRQLTHLIHGACGAETVMNWHLSEADRLASELAKHCSVNHSASRPTATAFLQQWNDDALEPPALHCEQLGRDVETLAIQFAEISDKDLAIPAHAWHNAGTALQRFAINIHHAGAAITQATGVSMHRWVVSIESFSQQVINVAKRIDYFTRVYSASHTALNDIMKHRREALENPAFRTYSFPEAPLHRPRRPHSYQPLQSWSFTGRHRRPQLPPTRQHAPISVHTLHSTRRTQPHVRHFQAQYRRPPPPRLRPRGTRSLQKTLHRTAHTGSSGHRWAQPGIPSPRLKRSTHRPPQRPSKEPHSAHTRAYPRPHSSPRRPPLRYRALEHSCTFCTPGVRSSRSMMVASLVAPHIPVMLRRITAARSRRPRYSGR